MRRPGCRRQDPTRPDASRKSVGKARLDLTRFATSDNPLSPALTDIVLPLK